MNDPRIEIVEQPLQQVPEQEHVDEPLDDGQPEKTEKEDAAGGEEAVRAGRAIACEPIDDAARREQPQHDVGACGADNHDRARRVVEKRREVVEHRAGTDHRRPQRDAESAAFDHSQGLTFH